MPPTRFALLACVIATIGMVVWSVVFALPPLWVLIAFFVLFATVINLATYFLNLQAFVDVWTRGPREGRGVALTFDDGPHPTHTREVLEILRAHDAKATFFVIGKKAEANPDVIREIAAAGHDIGVHTYSHDRLLNMRPESQIEEEIEKTTALIEMLTGRRPTLFRPPVGFTSPRITIVVRWLGINVVGWSLRAYDGMRGLDPEVVVSRIAPRLAHGSIVLLHDAFENRDGRPSSIDALAAILATMKARELEAVTISSWEPAYAREGRVRTPVARRRLTGWGERAYPALPTSHE